MRKRRTSSAKATRRIDPSPTQKKRLRRKNAGVCCVCKERHIGDNFHHLDGDSSNTSDDNLAVLCVRHHDNHHRPHAYNHVELGEERLRTAKQRWEVFVAEARKPNPKVLATVNIFGDEDRVDSMKLVFQWEDGRIEFERLYRSHDGPMESWIDQALEEIHWIGPKMKLHVISAPFDVDYCSCGTSFSHTVDENYAKKSTAENWSADSVCSIYVNPSQTSLALLIWLGDEELYRSTLHLCGGTHLHFADDKDEIRLEVQPRPSVRTQVEDLVVDVLADWEPARIKISTGHPDHPHEIEDLILPVCWEREAWTWAKKHRLRSR